MCGITAAIKKYKSIIKKMRKKHVKIVLLGKAKLDTIGAYIFMTISSQYKLMKMDTTSEILTTK